MRRVVYPDGSVISFARPWVAHSRLPDPIGTLSPARRDARHWPVRLQFLPARSESSHCRRIRTSQRHFFALHAASHAGVWSRS